MTISDVIINVIYKYYKYLYEMRHDKILYIDCF